MGAIDLYAHQHSAQFEAKVQASLALLQRAAREFAPITQASSLGAEDMVVTDLLQRAGIACPIFVLDTGKLHAETLALVERLRAHYQRPVDVYQPDAAKAAAFVAAHGEQAMYQSIELRKECCNIRKMEPLERALAGKNGWVTGLRREQSNTRADVADIEPGQGRAKINPLADWSWGDVWHYIAQQGVPYNPLHDQFMPSIGCAPCTRAISLGEDFRSGRWWWEQAGAKECGLHADHGEASDASSTSPISIIPIREAHA